MFERRLFQDRDGFFKHQFMILSLDLMFSEFCLLDSIKECLTSYLNNLSLIKQITGIADSDILPKEKYEKTFQMWIKIMEPCPEVSLTRINWE